MARNLHAVMRRHGPPSILELVDEPLPVPAHGQVRVRVETAGVSPADLLIGWGLHPETRRAPFTPGWDVIGLVDAVGSGTALTVGQRVAALTIVNGFSQYVLVPERDAVEVPDGLDPAAAQCLPFDYMVAYQMLHRVACLRRGASALVQGAAGSIGGALLQLGRLQGLKLFGTASQRGRAFVEAHGATFIDYQRDDFRRVLRERGLVDACFDGVGYTLWRSARTLKRGGMVVGYGHASSVMGGKRDWKRFAQILAQYGAVFTGSAMRRWRFELYSIQELRRAHPDWYREDLTALFGLLARNEISPRVFRVMALSDVREALQLVSDGRVEGKIVLGVDPVSSRTRGSGPAAADIDSL